MRKLLMLCAPGLDTFARPVGRNLAAQYDVRVAATSDRNSIIEQCSWADIVWLEFANEMAISVLSSNLADDKRIIVRLHSYEALSGMHHLLRWDKVDHLIFVSKNIRDIVMPDDRIRVSWKKPPENFIQVPHSIVPNGLEVNDFPFRNRDRAHGDNIAFVANLSSKKGIMLLVHAFHALTKALPRPFTLHLAGRTDEPRFGLYLSSMVGKLGLGGRMVFHGYIHDIRSWLNDKDYILCTSPIESQGMGIMEAMAMGIKPLIHDFVGAETIYPKAYLWASIDDLIGMLDSDHYESATYRKFIEESYSFKETSRRIRQILHNLPGPKAYNVFDYWGGRENPTDPAMPDEVTRTHIRYISENMPEKARVLEVGPGRGRTFEAYRGKQITGLDCVDVTDRHYGSLVQAAEGAGMEAPRLTIIRPEDQFRLPFADGQYDTAVVSEVLLHQRPEHIVPFMAEIVRVARKAIVISWMEDHLPFVEPDSKQETYHHCYHYHYPRICAEKRWDISDIRYANRQIHFCYGKKPVSRKMDPQKITSETGHGS